MFRRKMAVFFILCSLITVFASLAVFAQSTSPTPKTKEKKDKKKQTPDQSVRTVTVPISIFTKKELKTNQLSELVEAGNIMVKENGDEQTVLSIRSVSDNPLSLAIVVQDDLETVVNLEINRLKQFIRGLPKGSRVMVAYIRAGSLQIRQRFTEDLNKAADSLRVISGSTAVATNNPYEQLSDAIKKFDGLPNGRRAVLFISDGFDSTRGTSVFDSSDSVAADDAITKAQIRGAAIYSFYASGAYTRNAEGMVVLGAQGILNKLAEQTGGRAFFSGTRTPVSFDPFFDDLDVTLNRQFAVTYLSTHMNKGFHRVEVFSTNPDVKIEHPKGYRYRGSLKF